MSLTHLVDTYCASWSDQNAARRRSLLLSVWGDGATYTDPTAHTNGADELLAHIAGIQARYPGARISRTSSVDVHHGIARFTWRFVLADGSFFPEGLDIAFLDADQARITRIVGFFGPLATTFPT